MYLQRESAKTVVFRHKGSNSYQISLFYQKRSPRSFILLYCDMKLKLVRGCVCGSMTVDDTEEIDLTDEERQVVLDKIFEHLKPEDLNYVLQSLIEIFGTYTCENEPCECCGDIVEEWTWEI